MIDADHYAVVTGPDGKKTIVPAPLSAVRRYLASGEPYTPQRKRTPKPAKPPKEPKPPKVRKRRSWTAEQRIAIASEPGRTEEVAARHGIHPNTLWNWQARLSAGLLQNPENENR